MILTCPECATSYFVADGRIPAEGRRVRCSSCGHRWLAGPEGPLPEPSAVQPAPEPEPVPESEAAAPEEDIVVAPPEPPPFAPPPFVRPATRRAQPARADNRSALILAGAGALAVALIAGVIVFREQVVRVWPQTSAVYAGLGLQVAGGGLVLEQVSVKPEFLGGRPVLAVTGAIRNVRDVPVEAPPVRLTLLNRAGQPVAAKIARPAEGRIPPRAKRHFAVTMLDPPSTARDLEVRFEARGAGKGAARAAQAALPGSQPSPAAPQPVEAAPVSPPALSPPALSPTAATEHG